MCQTQGLWAKCGTPSLFVWPVCLFIIIIFMFLKIEYYLLCCSYIYIVVQLQLALQAELYC